jgi:GNAT superfamily N-acetyltransferase
LSSTVSDASRLVAATIRPASPDDAEGIARTFVESAEYHAGLDPERYSAPSVATVAERYQRHLSGDAVDAITFVAVCSDEIVGFVDARIEKSDDPMHRDMTYCHISEIAVRSRERSHGIGAELLRAAEAWGRCQGATFASLEYHIANARAGRFYQNRMKYSAAATLLIKRL